MNKLIGGKKMIQLRERERERAEQSRVEQERMHGIQYLTIWKISAKGRS